MEDFIGLFFTIGMYAFIPMLIILKRLHTRHLSKTLEGFVEDISTSHAHANERTTWYGQALEQADNAWFYFYLNAQRKQIGQFYYIFGHHSAPIKDFPPLDLKEFGGCAKGFAMRIVQSPTYPTSQVVISGTPEDALKTLLSASLLSAIDALCSSRSSSSELLLELGVTPSALMLRLDLQHIKELRHQLDELVELMPKLYAIHDGFKGQPQEELSLETLQAALLEERYHRCHKDIQSTLARRDPTKLPAALQEMLGSDRAPLHVRMGHAWTAPERYQHDVELLRWLAAQAGPNDPHSEQLTTPSNRIYPLEYIHQLMCHISIHYVATTTGVIPHHLQAKTLKTLSQTMSPEELEMTLLSAFNHLSAIPAGLWTKLMHHELLEHRELLVNSFLKHELSSTHDYNIDLLAGIRPQLTPTHEPILLRLLERSAPWRIPIVLEHLARVGTGLSYTTLSQSAFMSTHTKPTHKALNAILRRHKQLEHEHVGSLSLSAEHDEQHGALSLSQDAGALAMVEPQDDELA